MGVERYKPEGVISTLREAEVLLAEGVGVGEFVRRLRDELLNVELFNDLPEAKALIERWRKHFNTVRPHTSLRYQPTAPEAVVPADLASTVWRLQPYQPSNGRNAMPT